MTPTLATLVLSRYDELSIELSDLTEAMAQPGVDLLVMQAVQQKYNRKLETWRKLRAEIMDSLTRLS